MLPQTAYRRPAPPSRRPSSSNTHALPAHLLASPATAAAQMLNIDLDRLAGDVDTEDGEAITEEWVSERSREELSRMLVEAERTIKERERELGLAASIGKSLLERNMSLRLKHEALISRVPGISPSSSISGTSLPPHERTRDSVHLDTWPSDDEAYVSRTSPLSPVVPLPPRTPPATTFSTTSTSHPHFFTPPSARRRYVPGSKHSRTPSYASPQQAQALAHLHDQNASLQSQLEQLEQETTRMDRQGRRKLRKLEEELEGLKRELEETRLRNGELEEKVERTRLPTGVGLGFGAARGRIEGDDEQDQWEVESAVVALQPGESSFPPPARMTAYPQEEEERPMATHESLASLASSTYQSFPPSPSPSPARRQHPLSPYPAPRIPTSSPYHGSPTPRAGHSHSRHHSRTVSHDELTVVAQLIAKVSELERANREMRAQREELEERMRSVERETTKWEGVLDGMEEEERTGSLSVPASMRTHEENSASDEDEDDEPQTVRPAHVAEPLASRRFPAVGGLAKRRRKALPRTFLFPNGSPSSTAFQLSKGIGKGMSMPNTPMQALRLRSSSSDEADSEEETDPFAADYSHSGSRETSLSGLTPSLRAVKSLGDEIAWAEATQSQERDEGRRRFAASPLLSRWKGKGKETGRASTPPQVDRSGVFVGLEEASSRTRTMDEEGEEAEDTAIWEGIEGRSILRPGALRIAPASAFDQLHRAIEERGESGRVWADDARQSQPPTGGVKGVVRTMRSALSPIMDEATASNADPEQDIWASSRSPSPSPPESPSTTLARRRRQPTPQPLDPRLGRMFGDMWVMLLFMWTVGVFVVGVARRGPRGVGMRRRAGRD